MKIDQKYQDRLTEFADRVKEQMSFSHSDEMLNTVELMKDQGGSFVQSLVTCWHTADPINKRRLILAFQEYFFQYYQEANREEN